ncbi:hypothetical protein [Wenjunlia tyrosinilytica]|nr:hypothetical protein [Wenjunlia tyrosinilytica]
MALAATGGPCLAGAALTAATLLQQRPVHRRLDRTRRCQSRRLR